MMPLAGFALPCHFSSVEQICVAALGSIQSFTIKLCKKRGEDKYYSPQPLGRNSLSGLSEPQSLLHWVCILKK